MQTQNTHGWSTLQEGNAHYLYRPISSMGFTNLEAMIQQLQACQNKQIAVPEIVRIANGDIFLKEPRGIRSLEDFFKTDPTTRAKLFVAQQLVKLLENLHTFVGISHGGLGLHCLSIDADNKLVLGGISPTSQTPSEDIPALQALLTNIFNQPSESDTLKKIQSSSLKKMRRRIKMMLAEAAWDDVQADWSTAIDQTNIEESSEELPLDSTSANADGTLSAMVEIDSMTDPVTDSTRDPIEDVDIFEDELPEPVSFKLSSEQSVQDATSKQSNQTDFDWELDDDWEDVDIDGWLDPAVDSEAPDSDTENAPVTNNGINDNSTGDNVIHPETATHDRVTNEDNNDESQNDDRNEDRPEDALSTITPEMFGEATLEDWFNEPEDTMPLTKSDLLSATSDAIEEISDFEDDDEVLLFSMKPKAPKSDSSLTHDNVDSFDEKTEIFSSPSSSNMDTPTDDYVESDDDMASNETLDFLLENEKDDLASLTEEAQFQNIDEIDEFTVEEPSEEIPALDDDGDFATDIFSRSSLLGTLDIPADEVQSTLEEADMSDSWFVNTPKSTVQSTLTNENPSSVSNTDNGIPKWVWAASAAVVAGGAWAALHQNDVAEPAVLIDEAQTKGVDDIDSELDSELDSKKAQQAIAEADKDEQSAETIQMVASTNTNDDELSVNSEDSVALTMPNEATTKPAPTVSNSTKTTRIKSAIAKPKPKQTKKVRTTAKKTAPKKVSTKASPFTSPTETEAVETTTVKTLPTPKKKRPLPVEAPLQEKSSAQQKQKVEGEATPKPKQEANVQPIAQTVQEPVPAPIEKIEKVEQVEKVEKVEQVEKVEKVVETNNSSEQVQQDQESQQDTTPVEDTQPTATELSTEEKAPEPNVEDSKTEPDGSWGTLETPSLDTLNPISATDYRNWSSNAVQGKLNDLAIERLQSVNPEDASFTRANAILLTHAQQSGDAGLIGDSLEQLLSLDSNTHKPIYLLAMAQHQFNMQNLDGAREYLMQAELNWGNVERSQLMVLRAQRDNIVAHLSYVSFLESGSEDSRLQSLTQFRKVQREARRAKLRSLFEQAESKMQQLQRGTV